MSYNGSGTFNINTTGQPVVAGTVISSSAFNALTTDLATGLTTAITKDGQTTTTARITFAQGVTSSLVTDSSSVSTGSIITDGGVGIAKNLYVGGTLNVTGSTSLTNPVINNIKMGYTTTATAAGTTTLTVASNYRQFFTGTSTQTIVLPVTSTLVTGIAYEIENNSTGLLTVNSSGGNLVGTVPAGVCAHAVCIGTTLTTAADWDWDYISTTTITGTGANVLGTSPTITTPTISSLSSAAATALTLQSAGTTAVTIDTSQNVGINNTSPNTYKDGMGVTLVAGTSPNFVTIQGRTDGPSGATNSISYGGSYGSNPINGARMFIGAAGASGQQGVISFCTKSLDDNTTQPVERMRIDSSGFVLIGTTSTSAQGKKLYVTDSQSGTNDGVIKFENSASSAGGRVITCNANYAGTVIAFDKSNTGVGSISVTASNTAYNTSSDYRLKENIAPMTGALAKVALLKPVTFKWKIDGVDDEGFIAHELAEVKPNCVTGAKDATYEQEYEVTPAVKDEEGNITTPAVMGTRTVPVYQGIDTSFLVATLTAALQETKALIDTQAEAINALTARITALENA